MAQAFSTKNYFKKIYAPELLTKFYATHGITALFEIGEQTPRKTALDIVNDFYKSLSPEEKLDIEPELALINSISTKYAPSLCVALLKQKKLPMK